MALVNIVMTDRRDTQTLTNTQGKIIFRIERFSTFEDRYRYSEIVKIGRHEWNLGSVITQEDGKKYLGLYVYCNNFVPESSWTAQVKSRLWLFRSGMFPLKKMEDIKDFKTSIYAWGWHKFIGRTEIPSAYVINDSITVEAEIEILKETGPTVSFGSPEEIRLPSYGQVIQEQNQGNLFNNEVFSDVVFVVGPKELKGSRTKIFGHRTIIGLSSPVFAAMLFPKQSNCLASKRDEEDRLLIEIEDPETHPTALLSLFRFIYKKEIVVDRQLIHETLYLAEKYDTKAFAESLGFLVTSETILDFLPFVINVGDRHVLYSRCIWIMRSQIKQILNSDSFLEIDDEVMKEILSCDWLQIQELELFNGYVKWADHQCLKREDSSCFESDDTDVIVLVNDEDRRRVMKHLNLIRFPIMSLEEFGSGPARTDILTAQEKLDIYNSMAVKVPTTFSRTPRNF